MKLFLYNSGYKHYALFEILAYIYTFILHHFFNIRYVHASRRSKVNEISHCSVLILNQYFVTLMGSVLVYDFWTPPPPPYQFCT